MCWFPLCLIWGATCFTCFALSAIDEDECHYRRERRRIDFEEAQLRALGVDPTSFDRDINFVVVKKGSDAMESQDRAALPMAHDVVLVETVPAEK